MRTYLTAIFLLASAISAQAQGVMASPPVKLTAGLEASISVVGRSRDGRHISIAMQIENKGKLPAQIALVGPPPFAADNSGGTYALERFSGAAQCRDLNVIYVRTCISAESKLSNADYYLIPLQQYTQIDPGSLLSVTFGLMGNESNGTLLGFSSVFAYRTISDPLRDETLSDNERRKQIRTMSISFPSFPISQQK